MRRLLPVFAVLWVLPLLGSDSPQEYGDTTEVNRLEGTWQVIAVITNRMPQPDFARSSQTFRGGKWVWTNGSERTEGVYSADEIRRPAYLDTSNITERGSVWKVKYIYKVEGDTLRTAFRYLDTLRRPESFDEEGLAVEIWKRVKK